MNWNKGLLLFLLLFNVTESYSQNYESDTVCINNSTLSWTIIEDIPISMVYKKLIKPPEMDTLIINVSTTSDYYFQQRSYLFPNDTIIKTYKSGYQDTWIHTGVRTILANELTISNFSDKSVFIPTEDYQIVLIQEAKDKFGKWHPIDYFVHSSCGNSYSFFNLPNEHAFSIKIARYCGDFETKLRVRISLNKKDYLSNEFEGSINESQFKKPKSTSKSNLYNSEAY